jgi:hypothetical protein
VHLVVQVVAADSTAIAGAPVLVTLSAQRDPWNVWGYYRGQTDSVGRLDHTIKSILIAEWVIVRIEVTPPSGSSLLPSLDSVLTRQWTTKPTTDTVRMRIIMH